MNFVLCVAGNVAADEADVGFAVVYLWYLTFLWIDFTTALSRAGIKCLVPKPKMLPSWMSLWLPFSCVMCIIFIIITVVFNMLAETSNTWVRNLFCHFLHTVIQHFYCNTHKSFTYE